MRTLASNKLRAEPTTTVAELQDVVADRARDYHDLTVRAGQLRYDPELGMIEVQGHREYGLHRRARSTWPSRRLLSRPWRSTRLRPSSACLPSIYASAHGSRGPRASTTG